IVPGPPMEKDALILAGFKAAVKELTHRQGDIENWAWGNIHTVEYVHPIGRKKPLNHIFNIGPFPCPAASKVINKMSSKKANQDYKVASLPSTRRLVDCNAVDTSISIIPTGNSGNFLSPYYDNQTKAYLQGKYRPMFYTREQIRLNTAHRLSLVPENR
ncbi:MAG: penicillin acylase family protein, partial [Desulfovibrionales bacterium]|nr:penicillin acylase family protein [Desulfovibrionales bacterium]